MLVKKPLENINFTKKKRKENVNESETYNRTSKHQLNWFDLDMKVILNFLKRNDMEFSGVTAEQV